MGNLDTILDFSATVVLGGYSGLILLTMLVMGRLDQRRDLFYHLCFLILLSMIVNSFLKCLFQVPLKPHLGKPGWYAFPSGHMQLAVVFYGRLWWAFRKSKWAYGLLILLMGMGWAMVWKSYHDTKDVLGGIVVGVTLVGGYDVFIKHMKIESRPEKIGFYLLPLTGLLLWGLPSLPAHLDHAWQAQGALLGLSTGLLVARKYPDGLIWIKGALVLFWIKGALVLLSVTGVAFLLKLPFFGYPYDGLLLGWLGAVGLSMASEIIKKGSRFKGSLRA